METSKHVGFVGPLNNQKHKRIHSIQVMTTSVVDHLQNFYIWLVVSTHLKNSQIGSFPQVGGKIENV